MKFPENFIWGAATASYQIEGQPMKMEEDYQYGMYLPVKTVLFKMEIPVILPVTTITGIKKMSS